MSFRGYLRWDGAVAIAVGVCLLAVGLAQGHQGAVGAIKVGPAAAAISAHEQRRGATYRVARRPLRGTVELVRDEGARSAPG